MQRVGIFVFGDIGRSPRMQNHAVQLSKIYEVFFMGYQETKPRSEVINNERIHIVDLSIGRINNLRKISYYIYVIFRIIYQIIQILYLLIFKYRNLQFLVVQNPPSIPNLMAIWIASLFARFKIYIDFHNYGYTILALAVKRKIIIKIAQKYQKYFARRCHRAFCVSQQMQKDLKQNWGIDATVLYDKPLASKNQIQMTRQMLFEKYSLSIDKNEIICVSSTSWTKDEDFSILFNAVNMFDSSNCQSRLRVLITGKGPEKEAYLKLIDQKRMQWKKVNIQTLWLQADDYPILLSKCDFGVCLHYSSSGLDLPMKVVDMFHAGLPVLAVKYAALQELVKDGVNGYVFQNTNQLTKRMIQFCENPSLVKDLRKNVLRQKEHSWTTQWNQKFLGSK